MRNYIRLGLGLGFGVGVGVGVGVGGGLVGAAAPLAPEEGTLCWEEAEHRVLRVEGLLGVKVGVGAGIGLGLFCVAWLTSTKQCRLSTWGCRLGT